MRLRGEILILLGLFGLLAVLVAFTAGNADDSPEARGTSYSSGDDGTLALYRWLGRIGYAAERLEYRPFEVTPADSLLLLFSPSVSPDADDVAALMAWVEAGGTLILADDRPAGGVATLLRALDLQIVDSEWITEATAQQPAVGDPPTNTIAVDTNARLDFERNDVAVLLAAGDTPLLVGIQRGAGYVYVSSTLRPFTNTGLRDPAGAALVLNLLRRVPPGSRVLFDEVHHGFVTEPTMRSLLFSNAWGWAIIYALLMLALYLIATGRRFGRPVPLREETARRSSTEYLESMASLLRRGGKRIYLRDHYRNVLKRRLARPFGINPTLDDDAFVRALALAGTIDEATLRDILRRLNQPNINEAELLRLVAAADTLAAKR